MMRNKLLESAGWEVVAIPFNVWASLAGLEEKQVGRGAEEGGAEGGAGHPLQRVGQSAGERSR